MPSLPAPRRGASRTLTAPSLAPRAVVLCAVGLVGCSLHARKTDAPITSARNAPAHAAEITSDPQYDAARARLRDLAPDDPSRADLRTALEAYQIAGARRELAAGRTGAAWTDFEHALSLREAGELRSPAPDQPLADLAADLDRVYRRRGAHLESLVALSVERSLRPGDQDAAHRIDRLLEWLGGGAADALQCGAGSCDAQIDDLEQAVDRWPAPFLVEKLAGLYANRLRHLRSADLGLGEFGRFMGGEPRRPPASIGDLVRLYLRVSRPGEALAAIRPFEGKPGDQPGLREALTRYLSPKATPGDAVALAAEPALRGVGELVCRDAARRFPGSWEVQGCVGDFATRNSHIHLALRSFERAVADAPDRRELWEKLALLHQAYLMELVSDDRVDELDAQVRDFERFEADAARRFPKEPLRVTPAGAYYEVGRGYYNAGRIDDAVRYLERSVDADPAPALEQLAVIALKRRQPEKAIAEYQRALDGADAGGKGDPAAVLYWRAKLLRGLADAYARVGNPKAGDTRTESLADWDKLLDLAARENPDELPEVEVERGRLLYQLGKHGDALAAFEHALAAATEGDSYGPVFADVLAFLVPRGEREACTEVYHRALARDGVSDYLKVYFSLWILDLDRRTGAAQDPLADRYLAAASGDQWYDALARWASGRETEDQLTREAKTPGDHAELYFYTGMRRLADGRPAEARALLQKVLGTGMMAFFEYDMAAWYLDHLPALSAPATAATGTHP